jgi:TetR/AcrR family transcriptional repressor of nem operon
MRYPPEHRDHTRARIVSAAGRLFRRRGFAGVSVEKVMRAAGLTVGGFYLHFGSKQRLVTESLRAMLSARRKRWLAGLESRSGEAFRRAFVRRYVEQDASRMNEAACPMPALLSELTRARVAPRRALESELSPLLDEVARRLGGEAWRDEALRTVALCIGTVALSRALKGTQLEGEFIRAALGVNPTAAH